MSHADPIKAQLAAEYLEVIGYDPFEDCPEISVETVRQTLREHHEWARNARPSTG